MSHEMTRAVFESGLGGLERLVALELADHHNKETGRCDPAVSRMALRTGLCSRSVIRSLRKLQECGFIRVEKQEGGRNAYLFTGDPVSRSGDSKSQSAAQSPVTVSREPVTVSPPAVTPGPVTHDFESHKQGRNQEEPGKNREEGDAGAPPDLRPDSLFPVRRGEETKKALTAKFGNLPDSANGSAAPDGNPAPKPAPPNTPMPAKARPGSRRAEAEAEAKSANALPLPSELQSRGFPEAWAEWCGHRTELARRDPRKMWTPRAARNTLAECSRHGAELSVMAIRAALASSWQGLVWERLAAEGRGGGGTPVMAKAPVVNKWQKHPQEHYLTPASGPPAPPAASSWRENVKQFKNCG